MSSLAQFILLFLWARHIYLPIAGDIIPGSVWTPVFFLHVFELNEMWRWVSGGAAAGAGGIDVLSADSLGSIIGPSKWSCRVCAELESTCSSVPFTSLRCTDHWREVTVGGFNMCITMVTHMHGQTCWRAKWEQSHVKHSVFFKAVHLQPSQEWKHMWQLMFKCVVLCEQEATAF